MPRFYFEMVDGETHFTDTEGTELDDSAAAREEALRALGERVHYELPDGDRRDFIVRVLDDQAEPIVTATLSLRVTYPGTTGLSNA